MPIKTKKIAKTRTVCSINMDDCLWLDADSAMQRLLEKTSFGALLKKAPGDFSANVKKLRGFYQDATNVAMYPTPSQRLIALPAPLGTLLSLKEKSDLCVFFAAMDDIKANFIAINQHFLRHKSLNGFTINRLSPLHKKLFSKVLKEHYHTFINDLPSSSDKNIVLLSGSHRSNQQTDHRQATKTTNGTAPSSSQRTFFNDFTDYFNAKKKKSAHYDHFVLGDLFREAIDATQLNDDGSYKTAPDADLKKNTLLTDVIALDKNKILLLYAQMQHVAEKNIGTKITFKFYGKKGKHLDELQEFYRNNPYLIPHNVTLQLIQTNSLKKDPGIAKKLNTITGIGFIHAGWQNNCRHIIEKAGQQARKDRASKNPTNKIRHELKHDLIHLASTEPYVKAFCKLKAQNKKQGLVKQIKKTLKACPGNELLSDFFKSITHHPDAAKIKELQSRVFDTLPAKERMKLVNAIIDSYPITGKADYFLTFPINLQVAINQRLPILIAKEEKKITGPAFKFRSPITRESSKDKQVRLNQRIDDAQLQKLRLKTFQNQITTAIIEQHSQQKEALASADQAAHAQKLAHAFFQQKIIDCGLAQATSNPALVRFDPQGHVITEVTLKEPEDYVEILNKLHAQNIYTPGHIRYPTAKAALAAIMGLDPSKLTDTTYCSLDTKGIPTLQTGFSNWLITLPPQPEDNSLIPGEALQAWQAKQATLKACAKLLAQSDESSSINSLQLETEMHMRLNARGFEKDLNSSHAEGLNSSHAAALKKAHHQAASELNAIVRNYFQSALLESYQDNPASINFVTLNKQLDNARSLMEEHCQAILFKAYKEHAPEAFKAILDKIANKIAGKTISDHDFEKITATGEGLLRTDQRNATCVYYGATDGTAHDKKRGAEGMAFRAKYTSAYHVNSDHTPELTITASNRFEARVPSIALTNISDRDSIRDVSDKISAFSADIRRQSGNYSGPMNYCLLTSLSNPLVSGAFNIAESVSSTISSVKNALGLSNTLKKPNYDEQRKSASRILQGSHLFNKGQLQSDTPNALCFVQNIPVNQHGLALSHWSILGVVNEATLMAELSLLSMLYQKITADSNEHSASDKIIIRAYHEIKGQYVNFLQKNTCEKDYFYKSPEGRLANKYFDVLKAELKAAAVESIPLRPSLDDPDRKGLRYVENLISKALTTILAHDLHLDLRYGMLTQALSVFCHRASFYGCKSANERYMAVANRSELLDGIEIRLGATGNIKDLSKEEQNFIKALEAFTNPGHAVDLHATRKSLNAAYDKHGLQAAAATISYEDQGAASKVKASAAKTADGSLGAKEIDTNIAEVDLSKMASKHAGDNQAHKAHLVKRAKNILVEPEFLADYNEALKRAGKPPVEGLAHASHSMHGFTNDRPLDHNEGADISRRRADSFTPLLSEY